MKSAWATNWLGPSSSPLEEPRGATANTKKNQNPPDGSLGREEREGASTAAHRAAEAGGATEHATVEAFALRGGGRRGDQHQRQEDHQAGGHGEAAALGGTHREGEVCGWACGGRRGEM